MHVIRVQADFRAVRAPFYGIMHVLQQQEADRIGMTEPACSDQAASVAKLAHQHQLVNVACDCRLIPHVVSSVINSCQ